MFQVTPIYFYDDLARYASDYASRTLLSLATRQAEREGDFEAILALKIILIGFFFHHSGLDSKYAPSLMFDVVDYLGASERTRGRVKGLVTANLSGKAGGNIHLDKLMEHFIREVKTILLNLHRGFSDSLVDTAVSFSNPLRLIVKHELESLGLKHLVGGGGHARNLFSKSDQVLFKSEPSPISIIMCSIQVLSYLGKLSKFMDSDVE